MLFAAFGLNIGNLGRQIEPRRPMTEWLCHLNAGFTEMSVRAEALDFYRATGNFLLSADTDQSSEMAKWLSRNGGCRWSVLQLDELRGYLSQLERISIPNESPGACYTPGLVFRIDGAEAITSIEATVHARFQALSNRVIAAWKFDRMTDAGTTKDANNRGGGWGAVATDLARQVGGIWTARSMGTIRGLLGVANRREDSRRESTSSTESVPAQEFHCEKWALTSHKEGPMNLLQGLTPETLTARGFAWEHLLAWESLPQGGIRVAVPPGTDYFRDPAGEKIKDNGPYLWRNVTGDFVARLHVCPTFAGMYDAGGILVRQDEEHWAKLCFESTNFGTTAAISVVTRGLSDDANGVDLAAPDLWLQVCRAGDSFGMQYAPDGKSWRKVRRFHLPLPPTVRVGLLTQSPREAGTTVDFLWFSVESRTADTRTGFWSDRLPDQATGTVATRCTRSTRGMGARTPSESGT